MGWLKLETQEKVNELRTAVKDLLHDYSDLHDDLFLLRFLRSRSMIVDKAERMLRSSLRWRTEKNIDQLIREEPDSAMTMRFPIHFSQFKDGAPLILMLMKNVNVKGLLEEFGREKLYRYIIHFCALEERKNILWIRKRFEETQEAVDENFLSGNGIFVDFKGMPMAQMVWPKAVSFAIQMATEFLKYFPTSKEVCVAINCSKLAQPFIAYMLRTLERPGLTVEIYNTEKDQWKPALLNRAHAKALIPIWEANKLEI